MPGLDQPLPSSSPGEIPSSPIPTRQAQGAQQLLDAVPPQPLVSAGHETALLNPTELKTLATKLQGIQPTIMQRVRAVIAFLGTVAGFVAGGTVVGGLVAGVGAIGGAFVGLGVSLCPAFMAYKRVVSTGEERDRQISAYILSQPECKGLTDEAKKAFLTTYHPIVKAALIERRALNNVGALVQKLKPEVDKLKTQAGTLTADEKVAYDNLIKDLETQRRDIEKNIGRYPEDRKLVEKLKGRVTELKQKADTLSGKEKEACHQEIAQLNKDLESTKKRLEALQTYIKDAKMLESAVASGIEHSLYFGMYTDAIAEYLTLIRKC